MNPSSLPPVICPPNRRFWLWAFLLVPVVVLILLVAWIASFFHLDSDARALRNGLMGASGVEWRQRIALNTGYFALGAVRTGLSFLKLEPGAHAVIESVRGAGVGVYQLIPGTQCPDRPAMLAAADSAMAARGWERAVGVMEHGNMVAVYLPGRKISVHRVKCCVMVFNGKELVLVSALGNPEPLINFALNQPGLCDQVKSLAQR